MALTQADYVIDFSTDGGSTWRHGRTIPGWVMRDPIALRLQRTEVRRLAREEYGEGAIRTRTLREDDPLCALSTLWEPPPVVPDEGGQYPDGARVTVSRLQLVQVLADEGLITTGTGSGDRVFGALLKRTVADIAGRLAGPCSACAGTGKIVQLYPDSDPEPWRPGSYAEGVVRVCACPAGCPS